MKIIHFVIWLVFGLLVSDCTNSGQEKSAAVPKPHKYSESYKVPEFADTARMQRIIEILPVVEQIFKEYAINESLPGLAYGIVVDDSLVLSGGTGIINISGLQPVTSKSLFRIASMTKSFIAIAILKLRDEGKLLLSDPAARYIPELNNLTYLTEDAAPVKIEDLLTMTAGFPEDNPWGDRQLDDTNEELLDLISQGISFSTIPGYQYEYSNLGYAMLGSIISVASGIPFQEYITKSILDPLGMTNTCWEYSDIPDNLLALGYRSKNNQWEKEPLLHDGAFGAIGGLITSIDDFSKYVSFHLSAWPPHNGPETGPVKRSSLREMQKIRIPKLYPDATLLDGNPGSSIKGYGYGLRINKFSDGITAIGHSGGLPGFGSDYVFLPEFGIGIMSFCNLTYSAPWPANEQVIKVLFEKGRISARNLPASNILVERKEQVMQLINTWDSGLEEKILAENFYMDKSRETRIEEVNKILTRVGEITSIGQFVAQNQLRGTFIMFGENGKVKVFFSLTPENIPKVQYLTLRFYDY